VGRYRQTFRIEAPVGRLWELMNDSNRLAEWNRAFDRVENVTGPLDRVGTTYTQVMRVAGIELKGDWEITAVETHRRREFQGNPPGMVRCSGRETFQDAAGATDYTIEMEYALIGGPAAGLLDRLFGRSFVAQVAEGNIEALIRTIQG